MRLRRIALTLALAAAVVIQPLGNAQEPSGSPEITRRLIQDHLPVGALTASVDRSSDVPSFSAPKRSRTPSEFLTDAMQGDARSLMNPRTLARAQDALLEQMVGAKVPDLGSILEANIENLESSGSSVESTEENAEIEDVQWGFPGGDLDGDGLQDVLQISVSWQSSTYELVSLELAGLSGKTGAGLWTHDLLGLYDFFVIPGSDLNGDGAGDPILIELFLDEGSFTGTCAYLACAGDEEYSFSWRMSPLSGPSGASLWTKTYEGSVDVTFEFASALVASQYADRFVVTNGTLFPWITESDVVVNTFDYEGVFGLQYVFALVAGGIFAEEVVLVATDAEVIEGASGNQLFTRSQEHQLGGAILFPAGQAVGGPAADLVWSRGDVVAPAFACAWALVGTCLAPARSAIAIDMIDGDTFEEAWSVKFDDPMQEWAGAWPAGADLDGDGGQDLFYYQYLASGMRQMVISGSQGSSLWTVDGDLYLDVIGPVGGLPGTDILATRYTVADNGYRMDLSRLDGATGTELFKTTFAPNPQAEYADYWSFPFGDADGDGVLDAMIGEFSYDETSYSLTYRLESGRTGEEILLLGSDSYSYLFSVGDLNGDGTDDGLAFDLRTLGNSYELDIIGVDLPSGAALWTRTDTFARGSYWNAWLYRSGDMSGAGGADLIYNQSQEITNLQSRFMAIEGLDGVASWVVGDTFDPSAEITGAISGSVISESGDAIEGICVTGTSLDRYMYASVETSTTGTFTLTGLLDGTYTVRFDDCGSGLYAMQWYDGSSTSWEADLVEIVDGGLVEGINATMVAVPDPADYVLLREEEKEYIGPTGDLFTSGPIPGGLLDDCSQEGPSIGGTCFDIQSVERSLELEIEDSSEELISGYYHFYSEEGGYYYGTFCGASERIPLPPGVDSVWVFAQTISGLLECEDSSTPTTGNIRAAFYG